MARNDDRARDRRAKRRGEEPGEPEDGANPEPTGAESGDPDASGELGETMRAETDARAELTGPPIDVSDPVDDPSPRSELDPSPGGATVGGEVTTGGGPRFVRFLRASWAELQRVRWPDRQQVGQGTAVTLGFVVVAGTFLGLADVVARQIVNLIL